VAGALYSFSPLVRDSRIHRHNLNFLALECRANTEALNNFGVEHFPIQTLRPLANHGEAIYGVLVIKSIQLHIRDTPKPECKQTVVAIWTFRPSIRAKTKKINGEHGPWIFSIVTALKQH
jgi:hypothetical protein